ncbi:MAG: hypothetical protein WBN13_12485, partial [Robiginitalea sp.]
MKIKNVLSSRIGGANVAKVTSPRERVRTFFDTADAWRIFVQGSTLVLLIGAVNLVFVLQSDFEQYNIGRMSTTFGYAFMMFTGALFLFKAFYFLFIL